MEVPRLRLDSGSSKEKGGELTQHRMLSTGSLLSFNKQAQSPAEIGPPVGKTSRFRMVHPALSQRCFQSTITSHYQNYSTQALSPANNSLVKSMAKSLSVNSGNSFARRSPTKQDQNRCFEIRTMQRKGQNKRLFLGRIADQDRFKLLPTDQDSYLTVGENSV